MSQSEIYVMKTQMNKQLYLLQGLNATLKTLMLKHGFLTTKDALEKLADECV